jgi:hypothetical protein
VEQLVTIATTSSPNDWGWAGYMVAIISRACSSIEDENDGLLELVGLASDIASAILNAVDLAKQIVSETAKSLALFIRSKATDDMDLDSLIEIGIARRLEGPEHRASRKQYNDGKQDGILGSK